MAEQECLSDCCHDTCLKQSVAELAASTWFHFIPVSIYPTCSTLGATAEVLHVWQTMNSVELEGTEQGEFSQSQHLFAIDVHGLQQDWVNLCRLIGPSIQLGLLSGSARRHWKDWENGGGSCFGNRTSVFICVYILTPLLMLAVWIR